MDKNQNFDSSENSNITRVRRESGEFDESATEVAMDSQEYQEKYAKNRIRNFANMLVKLNMVPEECIGKGLTDALGNSLCSIRTMKNDRDNYYTYPYYDEDRTVRSRFDYRKMKPFSGELLEVEKRDNRLIGQSSGSPYKYQRYADEDEAINRRIRAMKIVLNWVRNLAIAARRKRLNQN